MPDEVNSETEASQAQGSGPAQTSEGPKYVTEEALTKALDSTFANVRRMVEGISKPKESKAPPDAHASAAPAVDVHAVIRREQEISEALAEQAHLTKEQRSLLRKLVDMDKPENVADFVANNAKAFGRPSGEAQTNTKAAANDRRPVSDAGASSGPPKFTDDTPIWKLSDEDRAQLIKQKGDGWYADTLRKQLKGVRVRLR